MREGVATPDYPSTVEMFGSAEAKEIEGLLKKTNDDTKNRVFARQTGGRQL